MRTAIIGYTGFVGGFLDSKRNFTHKFNSSNIQDLKKDNYELIICAGAPGTKWIANKFPEEDTKKVDRLMFNLDRVRVKRLVLISTIDVYPTPINVNESSKINIDELHTYGRNRRRLERFVEKRFSNPDIIRLPGIFGEGLKKNIIYDLITGTNLDKLSSSGQFQFYDLKDLLKNIEEHKGLRNLVTEPIPVQEIYQDIFGVHNIINRNDKFPKNYDVKTMKEGSTNYLFSKEEVKQKIRGFVNEEISKK